MKYTRFEKARLIGARALQIAQGAPFMIELKEKDLEAIRFNPIEIAKMEYEKGLIPIEIKRDVKVKQ
ncbi:MAG: DNA-directed RNA polymerase subunit K [Candidatus Woesearchaeota archaeon]|jgi:DNA-directed RNA polymerase subunit K